jgi:signal transduction histidine kinase
LAQAAHKPRQQVASLLAAMRQGWATYLTVRGDDLVQQVLNRGLLRVLFLFATLTCAAIVVSSMLGDWVLLAFSILFFLPIIVAIWLTRRGSRAGAVLLALCVAISNAVVFVPHSYTHPTVIHVIFLIPTVLLTLFVRPLLGFAGVFGQITVLIIALLLHNYSMATIGEFFYHASFDLLGITVPLYIGARVFHSTVARLAEVNQALDTRVAERTAELQRVMALRERDITAVVHDLNNRMTVVQAEIEELLLDAGQAGMSTQSVAAANTRLTNALNAVAALVDDLRTAVLLDNQVLRLKSAPLAVDELVRRVIAQFATQAARARSTLSLTMVDGSISIYGDEAKIERVLTNIVGNALKYTRQMPVDQRQVHVTLARSMGGALVRIEDSGPGLSAEALALLGQPFARFSSARGTEGMGLGVYISRGIVEHHRGWLRYFSPGPGRGTQVHIWLPEGQAE